MSQGIKEFSVRNIVTLAGAFSAFFCSVGFLNAFGVFQEYYGSHELRSSSAFDISWIGSVSCGVMFAAAPVAGLLVDRSGAQIPLVGGAIGMLVSMFMVSLCHEYYQFFLAQALLCGMSMSFLFCPSVAVISSTFSKHRGLALGITVGGSSTGGVIWPIVLDQLLYERHIGFPWTMRIVGFIMMPFLFLACVCVWTSSLSRGGPSKKEKEELAPSAMAETKLILTNHSFLMICSGLGLCYLGLFSPFFYVTSYGSTIGLPPNLAIYMVSIINAASLFGRILPGILADRYGHFNLCILAALLSGVIVTAWKAITNVSGLIVWSLAYGFCSGAIMSLQSACVVKVAPNGRHGTAIGMFMGSIAITALFGPPINGVLVDKYGYLSLSLFSGFSLLVGSILVAFSRQRLSRKVLAVI